MFDGSIEYVRGRAQCAGMIAWKRRRRTIICTAYIMCYILRVLYNPSRRAHNVCGKQRLYAFITRTYTYTQYSFARVIVVVIFLLFLNSEKTSNVFWTGVRSSILGVVEIAVISWDDIHAAAETSDSGPRGPTETAVARMTFDRVFVVHADRVEKSQSVYDGDGATRILWDTCLLKKTNRMKNIYI